MVRVKTVEEPIAGIVNLSQIKSDEVSAFVEKAFRSQSIREGERIESSTSGEYAIIWNSLTGRAEIPNFDNEVIDRLIANKDETVIVGIEDGYFARNYGARLGRKMKTTKYKSAGAKLSVRQIAEKDPASQNEAGALIAIRLAK